MSTSNTNQTSNQTSLPIHSTSNTTTKPAPLDTKISDGRRNSQGEELPSPTLSWKPTFGRTQSWDQQDLKRENMVHELQKENHVCGEFKGFTECAHEEHK